MNARTAKSLAAESGYTGSSPAMLAMFAAINAAGIREARAGHFERKRIIDAYKNEPAMFFNAIRPNLSTAETIEDAARVIFGWRRLPTWQQEARLGQVRKAKQMRLVARFYRRFGLRIWSRQAA